MTLGTELFRVSLSDVKQTLAMSDYSHTQWGRVHPTGRGEQSSAYDFVIVESSFLVEMIFSRRMCGFWSQAISGDTWIYSLEHDNWACLNLDVAPEPEAVIGWFSTGPENKSISSAVYENKRFRPLPIVQ